VWGGGEKVGKSDSLSSFFGCPLEQGEKKKKKKKKKKKTQPFITF
jgi:hypothetical protein